MYILTNSAANNEDSDPPTPDFTSIKAEREEADEGGSRTERRVDRREARVVEARGRSDRARDRNSSSGSVASSSSVVTSCDCIN